MTEDIHSPLWYEGLATRKEVLGADHVKGIHGRCQ